MKDKKNKRPFSKALLIQESILLWIITISFLALAFFCVVQGYFGELPWITSIVGFPWGAYAVSQACYYSKSKKENTSGGIVYDLAMIEAESKQENTDEDQSALG